MARPRPNIITMFKTKTLTAVNWAISRSAAIVVTMDRPPISKGSKEATRLPNTMTRSTAMMPKASNSARRESFSICSVAVSMVTVMPPSCTGTVDSRRADSMSGKASIFASWLPSRLITAKVWLRSKETRASPPPL